jgi:hypothetical protein
LAVAERDIHHTVIAPVETSTRPSSAQWDRSARLVTLALADTVGFRGSLAASMCATGQVVPAI